MRTKLAATHRQHSAGLIISGSKSPFLCYIATSYGSYRYIWLEDLSLFSNLDSATLLQFVNVVGVDCTLAPTLFNHLRTPWPGHSHIVSHELPCTPTILWTWPWICFVRDGRPVPSLNLPSPLVQGGWEPPWLTHRPGRAAPLLQPEVWQALPTCL